MEQEKVKYHTFPKKTMLLSELLPILRDAGYSNYDELHEIFICVEAEEWTWVKFNLSSCLLDKLGDLKVSGISARDDDVLEVWIETDEFNWFCADEERKD